MATAPSEAVADPLQGAVDMALAALGREYPYHYAAVLTSDRDVIAPRAATPAFASCFDWHSAVHSHWALARAVRLTPGAPYGMRVRTLLAMSLSPQRLAAEETFLRAAGREGFERPYGLAWLLQLAAELRGWDDPIAAAGLANLSALETLAASRLAGWLDRLPWPVRSGEHSQSAFALGLFHDWAHVSGHTDYAARIRERSVRLYGADREAPVRWEPSAHDFLSPLLGEADLLRRAMPSESFGPWLARFLPEPESPDLARWLTPVVSPDASDGKFAHLNGLNLSRAWMLEGIVAALAESHPHRPVLAAAAAQHRDAGLANAVTNEYAGSHWLGSFAIYLLTRRGLT